METKKIAVSCFIGGILCSSIALFLAPKFLYFGMIAGFAGGYISYEFREVLLAIPIAWSSVKNWSVSIWKERSDLVKKYFSQPHPLTYPAVVFAIPLFIKAMEFIYATEFIKAMFDVVPIEQGGSMVDYVLMPCLKVIFLSQIFYMITFVIVQILSVFAFIGARVGERSFWWPPLTKDTRLGKDYFKEQGLKCKSFTYTNVWRWIAKGIGISVLFFVWTLWKHLIIGLWKMLCLFTLIVWNVFILIHSTKRLLCAVDGMFGGSVSYLWLQSTSTVLVEYVMLVVFGGLLGAVFGIINWEIISKKVLHMEES